MRTGRLLTGPRLTAFIAASLAKNLEEAIEKLCQQREPLELHQVFECGAEHRFHFDPDPKSRQMAETVELSDLLERFFRT